jgi:hypothetical protein
MANSADTPGGMVDETPIGCQLSSAGPKADGVGRDAARRYGCTFDVGLRLHQMNVVVVESPAKAKTINKYLGKDFKVLASYGHVRDLPAKDGSVKPDEGFAMIWEVDARANKRIKDIADALKGADRLYLATDPDREGEAISWHIAGPSPSRATSTRN